MFETRHKDWEDAVSVFNTGQTDRKEEHNYNSE